MTVQREFALLVAGGYGTRMGSEIPKQFIPVAGKPVLMHTLEAFVRYSQDLILIVVLPEDQISRWKKLCGEYSFSLPHLIKEGGATRFQSVKKGLELIKDDGLVAIHDGVRPLVSPEIISSSFQVAARNGSAVCSVPLLESLRRIENEISFSVNRNNFAIIQTPQTFQVNLIKKAYELKETDQFTDDASVYEASGMQITLIEGSYSNIKITNLEDLIIAESLMGRK